MAQDVVEMLAGGFVACMILITVGLMVYLMKMPIRTGERSSRKESADETQMIQEIYHGMTKLEQRVESLETLVLDDERAKRSKFDRELSGE